MWEKYNPNPCGRSVGDCAVRAIAKALDVDWETAYLMLARNGYDMCDMPSSNSVWSALLRQRGFRCIVTEDMPTFGEFVFKNKSGVSVLCSGTHVATAIDGILYDAWDSSKEPLSFYWYKKER